MDQQATSTLRARPQTKLPRRVDVAVVGAGHNGLVSAILLARAGLDVLVLEAADVVGGAARTETPFPRVPELRHSTGSYLLGLMPPELLARLDVRITVLRRDPHYFLPTPGGPGSPYLLFGADPSATRRQFAEFFSPADVAADAALQAELAALRADLAPAWLAEPLPVEETAERYVRPALRQIFVDLVRGSVVDYLSRFDFHSELLISMYAVTDGLSGVNAGPDDPGTGHNFLVHNNTKGRRKSSLPARAKTLPRNTPLRGRQYGPCRRENPRPPVRGRAGGFVVRVAPQRATCPLLVNATNERHASGPNTSAGPVGSLLSRTPTMPGRLPATSTQLPPPEPLRVLLRH